MESSRFDSISRRLAERRISRRRAMQQGAGAVAAGTLAAAGLAGETSAQDATPAASPGADADEKKVSYLFVQSFGSGSIAEHENGNLTLTADHLTGQTIFFSDRPERIVGTVNTERFLGLDRPEAATPVAGMGDAATPDAAGIGFSAANPPNAALVFNSPAGSDEPGDVLVVELIDPTYDPATGRATYEIKVLADEEVVDMTLVSEPVSTADAIRDFEGASLFIDDCGDGSITCHDYISQQYVGTVSPVGFCWVSSMLCCNTCTDCPDCLCEDQFGSVCRGINEGSYCIGTVNYPAFGCNS